MPRIVSGEFEAEGDSSDRVGISRMDRRDDRKNRVPEKLIVAKVERHVVEVDVLRILHTEQRIFIGPAPTFICLSKRRWGESEWDWAIGQYEVVWISISDWSSVHVMIKVSVKSMWVRLEGAEAMHAIGHVRQGKSLEISPLLRAIYPRARQQEHKIVGWRRLGWINRIQIVGEFATYRTFLGDVVTILPLKIPSLKPNIYLRYKLSKTKNRFEFKKGVCDCGRVRGSVRVSAIDHISKYVQKDVNCICLVTSCLLIAPLVIPRWRLCVRP